MSLQGLLLDRIDIWGATITVQSTGEAIRTFVLRRSNEPCLVRPLPAERRVELARDGILASLRLFHAHSAALAETDRIAWNGRWFEIALLAAPTNSAWPGSALLRELPLP